MNFPDLLYGLALITGAAGLLLLLGRSIWTGPDGIRASAGIGCAWGVTLLFFLPARFAFLRPGAGFVGLYVAGFLTRLVLLGAALALSPSEALPVAMVLSMFLLELVAIFWVGRRAKGLPC